MPPSPTLPRAPVHCGKRQRALQGASARGAPLSRDAATRSAFSPQPPARQGRRATHGDLLRWCRETHNFR
jgi:hypothetical protein